MGVREDSVDVGAVGGSVYVTSAGHMQQGASTLSESHVDGWFWIQAGRSRPKRRGFVDDSRPPAAYESKLAEGGRISCIWVEVGECSMEDVDEKLGREFVDSVSLHQSEE